MTPRFVSRLWVRRYLSRHACSSSELKEFAKIRPSEQRRALARKLLDQIQYFGQRADALPEWREAARIQDPDVLWRVWPSLPILTKKDLQERFPAAEIGQRFGIPGVVNSTGGSTGEPTRFFHDTTMIRKTQAVVFYTREQMGWRPGMPTIIVWGSERDIGRATASRKQRFDNRLRNEYLLDGYHLGDQTVDRVLEIAHKRAPVAIYGFTSMLEFVARAILNRNAALRSGQIAAAWNGGEMLFQEQKDVFRLAFGHPLLNIYGGRELSAMACQTSEDGYLEVLRPWLFLEIVDDAGRPTAPGESGRLIWTSTVCHGTPFLRYDIEDLGSYNPESLTESGISAIAELHGRVAGLLELPDGRKINNIYWNHLFKEITEVKQFQVILRSTGQLNILLIGARLSTEREQQLRAVLRNFLGPIPVDLKWVDNIPRTSQGKLVQVIREKPSPTQTAAL
jgi:phenylacetate-coenzyme A ligase PaaK-like adenylate-forming protein